MYSRVATAQALLNKLEEAVLVWRDSVVPANSQKRGWGSEHGGTHDEVRAKIQSITVGQ